MKVRIELQKGNAICNTEALQFIMAFGVFFVAVVILIAAIANWSQKKYRQQLLD